MIRWFVFAANSFTFDESGASLQQDKDKGANLSKDFIKKMEEWEKRKMCM